MTLWRESAAGVLSIVLFQTPASGAANSRIGAILSAARAHVGTAPASAGTTVFGGDILSTEQNGNLQIRAGAARLLLAGSSSAMLGDVDGTPSVKLYSGTAVFSTAIAKAFTLLASTAEIRPRDDVPTVAQVSIENPKQFTVRCSRGALTVTIDGETRIIPEGEAYRVVLDSDAAPEPQGPRGVGTKDFGGLPRKPGKNHTYLVLIGVITIVTIPALHEVVESPDKP